MFFMVLFSGFFVSFVVGHGVFFVCVCVCFLLLFVVVRWGFCLFVLFAFFSSGDINEEVYLEVYIASMKHYSNFII